jgi:hypothetical protein
MGLSQLYGNWEEAGYTRPQLSESFSPERTKVEIEVEVVAVGIIFCPSGERCRMRYALDRTTSPMMVADLLNESDYLGVSDSVISIW